jgi:uncharacterized membrane protein (UPF0127 family)
MRYVSVINSTTGAVLAARAAVAESFTTRFFGLQGRRSLPPGTGLVLLPTSSIHMLFMFMRIDAVFVGADGVVLRIGRRLRPWTIGPIVPGALYCVELPDSAATGTEPGHTIELRSC